MSSSGRPRVRRPQSVGQRGPEMRTRQDVVVRAFQTALEHVQRGLRPGGPCRRSLAVPGPHLATGRCGRGGRHRPDIREPEARLLRDQDGRHPVPVRWTTVSSTSTRSCGPTPRSCRYSPPSEKAAGSTSRPPGHAMTGCSPPSRSLSPPGRVPIEHRTGARGRRHSDGGELPGRQGMGNGDDGGKVTGRLARVRCSGPGRHSSSSTGTASRTSGSASSS